MTMLHHSFTLTRDFDAAPVRVFSAWSDPAAKQSWFAGSDGPDWRTLDYGLDFSVGGREHGRFLHMGTTTHENETVYHDIVADQRIVFSYVMAMDGRRVSASLATVEIVPHGPGARLSYCEQSVYLDGLDSPESRINGWNHLLTALEQELARG